MSLTEMSFFGGAMILVIIVVRAAALHRLPKWVFCLLWGLTVLRLLAPVSVPSPLKVYAPAGPEKIVETARPVQRTAVMPEVTAPAYVSVDISRTQQFPVRLAVWGTGTVLCAAFFTASYVHCRRKFSGAEKAEQAEAWLAEHRLRRPMSVRRCGEISAPLTYGILRPVILVPVGMAWDEQTEWVLEHEFVHVRRFDAAAKLLLTAAVCAHWFNPLVWVMYVLANRDIELSCDEAVVRRLGLGKKSAYALTLISMEETKSGLSPLASSFSKNAIEERIMAIMKMKKTSAAAVVLAAVLVCGVSAGFAVSAEERPEDLRKYVTALANYSEAESQKLLSLWLDGYEDMTIADYQRRMWTIGDNQEDMELIDRFTADGIMVFSFRDEKESQANMAFIDYFYRVYSPLISESWQNHIFSDAAGGTLLEYNYAISVSDAEKAKVGEYEKLHKAVKEAMSALATEEADLERRTAALEERLSTDCLQVDIMDFVFQPEETGPDADLYRAYSDSAGQEWAEQLAPYLPFGLTYEYDDPDNDGNGLTMYYQGREVRGIVDEQSGIWLTEHAGTGFSADAIELYTVCKDGILTGLRPATAEEQAEWDRLREQNRRQADALPQDPREFPNATEEDYASFLELMKYSLPANSAINLSGNNRDYRDMTLADFNQRLLDWGNENPDAYNRIMCDVLCDDYAVTLSGEEKQFAAVTCNLSGTENGMYVRSIHTGRPEEDPGFSENLPDRMTAENGITAAWCELYYQCSYHITGKSAVTVRERDTVISGFRQDIRSFWNETDMDGLLSMTEDQAVDRLNSMAAEHSTDSVRIIPMTAADIHLDTMDERGHN